MNPVLAALLPFLKPFVKQIYDGIVVPEMNKLIAQIPNADAEKLLSDIEASVNAEVDKLLS